MVRGTRSKVIAGATACVLAGFVAAVAAQGPQAGQAPQPGQGPGAAPQRGGGPPAPPAPTGPFAPEKYKNIQVLKDVPADQLEPTMMFVAAATGFQCTECHVKEADGSFSYDKDDKRTKGTARDMMKIERGVNEQFFNNRVTVTCFTCHRGANRPVAQPALAELYTPEQLAALAAAQMPNAGGPQGGAPGGGFGGRGGPPLPAVEDVLKKYVDALGGDAALGKLQSLVFSGTVTNRAGQAMPFTIEQKTGGKYRESVGQGPSATTRGVNGSAGWMQSGASTVDLSGLPLEQAGRLADLGRATTLSTKYTNVRAVRGMPVNGAATTGVSGSLGPYTTETFYFDASTGLLLRRTVSIRTALGNLPEQIDYSDYRDVAGVKLPFTIRRDTWDALDVFKVADVKPNAQIDDARFTRPR